MSLIYLGGFILLLILLFIFLFRGILGMAFLGFIGAGMIKLKIDEIKNKGVNRFGSLPCVFVLTPETVTIGSNEFPTESLTNLKIDAEDFMGGPGGDMFGASLGTENYIEFTHNGENHSWQFLVKRKSDLELIQQIGREIIKSKVA